MLSVDGNAVDTREIPRTIPFTMPFDETFDVGTDTRTSIEILALLQRLNRGGLTIVLVTHEPDIATYASRVLVFRDGRLLSDERRPDPQDAAAALAALPLEEEALA